MKRNLLLMIAIALALLAAVVFFFRKPVEKAGPAAVPTGIPTAMSIANDLPVEAGPALITGEFSYSNDFVVETYFVEHAVALTDMTGFILRDKEWELPEESQVLGMVKVDRENNHATYRLQLPVSPEAESNDVDQDGSADPGVQILAIGYSPNLSGDPFSAGDDKSFGWPSYLASVKTDSENNDEITGGKLLLWAPDASQQFPTGFGADSLLFTSDDPVGQLAAGYTVVDLDQSPFAFSRSAEQTMTLYEPTDVAIKDYSSLSYSKAFEEMFTVLRREYAFNGVEGKQPDWDVLHEELAPLAAQAEKDRDAAAFYEVLHKFTLAFNDGHVGLDGGEIAQQIFTRQTSGGFGFAIRELDGGKVVVIFVLEDGPAAAAGMETGAEIKRFNDQPIGTAIGAVVPLSAPHSSEFALRYQQARYLLAAEPGMEASIVFANPGKADQAATLTAVAERSSLQYTSLYRNYDPNALPVESTILSSGVGYVRLNSNYDDLNLIVRLFERALQTFEANQLPGVIFDLRKNSGGSPLELAGFLTDKEIPLGQLSYFSEKTEKFEPEGPRDKVRPKENQYRFDRMVLLVDQACYSACEIEAYGFSKVPGMIVIGQYPTGGVEAEVARGQFALPGGFSLQAPTGRFTLADGSLFLEGTGVVPAVRVPIDEQTVFSEEDVVLGKAVEEILAGN